MSAALSALPANPGPTARDSLIAALRGLARDIEDIRLDLKDLNDTVFRPKIEHAIDVAETLLAGYLPEPSHRVKGALEAIYLAAENIDIPAEDEALGERTRTLKTLRGALGCLRVALDTSWKAANAVYPGDRDSLRRHGPDRLVPADRIADFQAKIGTVLSRLDELQAVVETIGHEKDTAPNFAQQSELVTFQTRTMTVEIDIARLHLKVNDTALDLGAIVDTVEELRDTTADYRATVHGWIDDVRQEVLTGAENLNDAVRRLVSGVRALGGMIGASNADAPDMVVIPRGTFLMGIPLEESKREDTERYDKDAQPQREVSIRRPFLLGRTPVTAGEYEVFVQDTNRLWEKPDASTSPRHPAVNVGFADAMAYIAWLSDRTGETYRLPSEAEWEYACRAGTTTARWWGDAFDPKMVNFGRSGRTEVGTYSPNPWGLRDMLGTVAEWVADSYHADLSTAPRDGTAWTTGGSSRVLRGGFVNLRAGRAGYRVENFVAPRSWIGFRLARTL